MNFNKPGANKRVCGYLIDLLVICVAQLVISEIFKADIHWLLVSAYWLIRDSVNGQSIGKFCAGIQVINKKGEVITPIEGIIRNFTIAIPFANIIEYIVMLNDEEGKRIGDKIAQTRVRDMRPQVSESAFLWISVLILIIILVLLQGKLKQIIKSDNKSSLNSSMTAIV